MAGKSAGRVKAGNLIHGAQHRHPVSAPVAPARPGPDDLGVRQFRKIFHNATADAGGRPAAGDRRPVVLIKGLQPGGTAEHKGAVLRLVAVKVRVRRAKHLIEHGGFCLSHKGLQKRAVHRHVDAHRSENLPAVKAGSHQHLFSLIYVIRRNHLSDFSFYCPKLRHRLPGDKPRAQPAGHLVEAKCRGQRIGVAVRGTPACHGYFMGKMGIDTAHLVAVNHAHIQAAGSGPVRKALQYLSVLFRLPETQVSVLMIFAVRLQLFRQVGPESPDTVHGQRKLPGVPA